MLKPLLLTVLAATMAVTPTTTQFSTVAGMNETIDTIQDNIYKESNFLREGNSYLFNGKEYRSENEILKELLKTNPITEVATSSDPSKIIVDYSSGKIDQNKVYGTNSKEFTKVARNYFGKTILPSCQESANIKGCVVSNKTAEERAFASFVNPGLTRIKYSYDNSLFYDAPAEAEVNYKTTKFESPQNTLMYYYNGRYYNAVNKNDLEKMKQSMEQGLYYDPSSIIDVNDSKWKNYELAKPFTATNKNFGNEFKNKFKADLNKYFSENNNENILEPENENVYKIEIEIGDKKDYFLVDSQDSLTINKEGGTIKIYSKNEGKSDKWSKDILVIEARGTKLIRSIGTELETFVDSFKKYNSWKKGLEIGYDVFGNIDDEYYDYYTKTFNFGGNNFTIKALSAKLKGIGYTKTNLHGSSVLENGFNSDNDLKVNEKLPIFLKNIINEAKKLDVIANLIKTFKNELFIKKWSGTNIVFKNEILNQIAENASQLLKDKKVAKDDWIYNDNGIATFSVLKSEKEKKILLEKFEYKRPNEKFSLNPLWELQLTYNEWKNNFFYLEDANFGKVSLDDYWYIQEKGASNFKFSDLMGVNIAKTINEAQQIQFDKETPVLYKKYYLYNPNGEMIAEDYNETAAFNYLKTFLHVKTGFVNKNELPNLEDGFSDFNNLISNGKYLIFKFKFENQQLYFNNYENAITAYKNNIDLISGVSVIYQREFVYTFVINGEVTNYYWKNDEELRAIAKELYLKYRGDYL